MTRINTPAIENLDDAALDAAVGAGPVTEIGHNVLEPGDDRILVRTRTGLYSMEEGETCGI